MTFHPGTWRDDTEDPAIPFQGLRRPVTCKGLQDRSKSFLPSWSMSSNFKESETAKSVKRNQTSLSVFYKKPQS